VARRRAGGSEAVTVEPDNAAAPHPGQRFDAESVDRNPAATVVAIVLAAGFSSRMGAFKPLLPFGERTLIDHVVTSLRAAGVRRIRVVTGFNAEALAPELVRLGVARVHNPGYAKGMFSSVKAGVASLPPDADGFLLAPVDMPLIRPSTIARVVSAAASRDSAVVYPTFRGERGHPPLVRRSLFAEILASDGEGGLRALLARHPDEAGEVAVFDRGCLTDMDHPGDYRALAAAFAGHREPDAEECESMLDAAATPIATRRHCRAVAALAMALARRLQAAGEAIDPDLARAAALVHDIAKGRRRHAEAGATLLRAFGFPEVAGPVARHMSFAFDSGRLDETAIVYLADKLVKGEARVSLKQRFAAALERFGDDPASLAGVRRRLVSAEAIAKALEARIGPLGDAGESAAAEEGSQARAIAV
jgi:putative nucleotidyltransferase with HDIG domain